MLMENGYIPKFSPKQTTINSRSYFSITNLKLVKNFSHYESYNLVTLVFCTNDFFEFYVKKEYTYTRTNRKTIYKR